MYQGTAFGREGCHVNLGLGEGRWKVECSWMKLRALGWLCPTEPLAREGGFNSTLQRPNLMVLRLLLSLGQIIRCYERRVWMNSHFPYWDASWGSWPMVGQVSQRQEPSQSYFPLRCLFCSTCRPEALRWMTTHSSGAGVRPTCPPYCSLVFAISPYKVLLFAPMGPEGPGTQLQRGHHHSRWQVEINQTMSEPKRLCEKMTQVLERR